MFRIFLVRQFRSNESQVGLPRIARSGSKSRVHASKCYGNNGKESKRSPTAWWWASETSLKDLDFR